MGARNALVLFDIDGTLVRRAGPHHRDALIEAVRRVTGITASMDGVAVAGMLDPDILTAMMQGAGMSAAAIRAAMPRVIETAQRVYLRICPVLNRRVCPGVRAVLRRLQRDGFVLGLVTGNLTRIGWRKLDRAGLREYFRFGAFGEMAVNRAGLARHAIREARREGWIGRGAAVSLVGDHVNDIRAARANRIRAIAVATGVLDSAALAEHNPDVLLPDLRGLRPDLLELPV
ncbi:MAG TPA: HAD family hydrolase [Bryobacteraceae bacterium]|nr:HAD family hydrolase [Bryobacteraceae bacterium]